MTYLIRRSLFLTLVGIAAISCTKDEVSQTSHSNLNASGLSEEAINQKDFKFSYEVTIGDKEQGQYAKYMVYSNDESVAQSMAEDLKASTLILSPDKDVTSSDENIPLNEENNQYEAAPYDFEKGVHLVEIERSLGDANGYAIDFSKLSESRGNLNSYSTITITANAGGIFVRNLWVYPNHNYHYFSDGTPGWNFDMMRTLSYYQHFTFTGGGFTDHRMVIIPSYINSSFQHNNKIYWSVWP